MASNDLYGTLTTSHIADPELTGKSTASLYAQRIQEATGISSALAGASSKPSEQALQHIGEFSVYKAENGLLLVYRDNGVFKSWIITDGKDLAEKITTILVARKITE